MVPALSAAMTMPSLIFTETMMVTARLLLLVSGGPARPLRRAESVCGGLSSARLSIKRLQKARHPTGCTQCLPRDRRDDRKHDGGECQGSAEQDAILLQVGAGDQCDCQSKRDVAQRHWDKQAAGQHLDDTTDDPL